MVICLEFEFIKFDFHLSKFKFQKELYKITFEEKLLNNIFCKNEIFSINKASSSSHGSKNWIELVSSTENQTQASTERVKTIKNW